MNFRRASPYTVTAFYALLAIVWLSLSDYVVFSFVKDKWIEASEYTSDLLFVVLSSSILFYIIRANNKDTRIHTQKYRDLFENNPQPMWVYDPDTLKFIAVNNATIAQYGYSKEEFAHMTKRDIRLEEDLPTFLEELQQVKHSLKEIRLARHKKKDGTLIHVELTSRSLTFEGKPAIMVLANDITQRIDTLNKFKQQEELLHSIFNNTPTGICITNEQGYFEQVNDAYCKIYSYTPQELIGKHFTIVVPPSMQENMRRYHDKFIAGQDEIRGEWQVKDKYGKELYIMADAALIKDNSDRRHKATFVTDITNHKKAEADLRITLTELQNYKNALDKSALVSVTDLQGTIIYVNEIFCRTAKYTPEELVGRNHRIINSGFHPKSFWKDLWKTIGSGKLWRGEIRNKTKDGRYYWVYTIINPVFDPNGQLINYLSIRYEITGRKNTEERIKASEKRLKEAQEIAHIGSWEYSLKEHSTTWSEEIFRIHGIPKEKGNPSVEEITRQIYPEDLPHYLEVVTRALREGEPYNIDVRIVLPGTGEIKYINLIGKPVINETGELVKLYGTTMDINERKLAEKNLEFQNEELKKINIQLDRFVYSAGHDLRAPLMSVLGLINIAQMDPTPSKKDEYMELMRRSINKLDNFIKDIINFSRNSRTEIINERINFNTQIQEILDSLSNFKGIEAFETNVTVDENAPFYTDAKRLSIILNNLISNAIRYSDPYKKQSYVHIAVTTTLTEAHISVEDNGIGIEEEHLEKIFNMFYRATESMSGSGLGLYIVKETIDMLGGKVQVASIVGKGTTFTLTLPNKQPK
jgi:PAS domain S-box-containing protein